MSEIDLQSEQFMTLLSEALRAGPGSPQWHQVLTTLRASGAQGADELQILIQAREDLESGKAYRAVSAGPGFTRKVMTAIEDEPAAGRNWLPSANMLAIAAAGVILAMVVIVAVVLVNKAPDPSRAQIDQLRSMYFVNPVRTLNAEVSDKPEEWKPGSEWKTLGEVTLKAGPQGLRPASTQPSADKREYRAGAIETADPIPADQPILLDVAFRVIRQTDAIVPQVLVSDEPLSAEARSAHELVWLMKGGQPIVQLPDGSVPVRGEKLQPKAPYVVNVKIRLNKEAVIVESGDKRLYEGKHLLAPDKPRHVGVRFLRKVGDGSDGVWLTSVQVLKP